MAGKLKEDRQENYLICRKTVRKAVCHEFVLKAGGEQN